MRPPPRPRVPAPPVEPIRIAPQRPAGARPAAARPAGAKPAGRAGRRARPRAPKRTCRVVPAPIPMVPDRARSLGAAPADGGLHRIGRPVRRAGQDASADPAGPRGRLVRRGGRGGRRSAGCCCSRRCSRCTPTRSRCASRAIVPWSTRPRSVRCVTSHAGTPLPRLDTVALRRQVLDVPGVRAASVTRSWPHGLLVTVVARDPVAAVPDSGGFALLDADGVQVGRSDTTPKGLPVVDVPLDARGGHDGRAAGAPAAAARARDARSWRPRRATPTTCSSRSATARRWSGGAPTSRRSRRRCC